MLIGTQQIKDVIQISSIDNVAICIRESGLNEGDLINTSQLSDSILIKESIKVGHKVALKPINAGDFIFKFGHIIGVATAQIPSGCHVHVQNCRAPRLDELKIEEIRQTVEDLEFLNDLPKKFLGYRRSHGSAGIRNYVVVVATVNCSASVVKHVCNHFRAMNLSMYGIDGIIPITHQSGCAQAIGGLNYETLNKTLAGWTFHPNVVGALFVGLGCEGTTAASILDFAGRMGILSPIPIEKYTIQEVGGTSKAIQQGIQFVESILKKIPPQSREEVPVSELSMALNCGGSDSFSSLTANPVLGVTTDILTQLNGTSVLAEIPECHGAEWILEARSNSPVTVQKLREMFGWWYNYTKTNGATLNNNLSPGNIAGGITTIVEKSLGAVSKSGKASLVDVVGYSEPIRKNGFVLMNTPGFDPVSVTGLVAGGCQLVAFTTGRGSTFGASIAPTIKIATNSRLFMQMNDDMDFNAGELLDKKSVHQLGADLYKLLIDVAGGKKTKSESLGLGWEEFAPWPIGETL